MYATKSLTLSCQLRPASSSFILFVVSNDTTRHSADLVGKIVYNDPAVFRRLRVNQLTEQASMKTPEALELQEINNKANDPNKEERSGNHGCAEEKRMYDPKFRVVPSLACNLSIDKLGLDPTVRVLTDLETQNVTESRQKYPSVVVSPVGNIWRVREYVEGVNEPFLRANEMILKTAWRSTSKTPESDICLSTNLPPEGLTKFECCGDVKLAGYPIALQNLRSQPVRDFPPGGDIYPPTPVLHRLVLSTVGRPMWEYTSDRDLLTGFRDALQAHKAVCAQGILHRDISAGNVLLTEAQNAPLRGFISDLEFAHFDSPTLSKPHVNITSTVGPVSRYGDRGNVLSTTQPTPLTHITFESTVKRGADMTGTAQFMARDILLQEVNSTTEDAAHKLGHVIESFVWVFSYCVMRNLCHRASEGSAPKEVRDECKEFRYLFHRAFGHVTAGGIANQRQTVDNTITSLP
ncbi:hypothetical protein BDZ97DRAFT_1346930 [Flammula alnicola]|nr:hypothetical protein BDZ97DRAFT_1346930 [Flammula alnicola]